MLACINCGELTHDRTICIHCGNNTEVVDTFESVIISELIKIIIGSELFARHSVVWSHNNPNDGNTMQIRLWAPYAGGWEAGRYIGHVEIDDGIIIICMRCLRGGSIGDTFKIPLADPSCFEHFKEVMRKICRKGAYLSDNNLL